MGYNAFNTLFWLKYFRNKPTIVNSGGDIEKAYA